MSTLAVHDLAAEIRRNAETRCKAQPSADRDAPVVSQCGERHIDEGEFDKAPESGHRARF